MLPPQPQFSLPTPKYLTRQGFSRPLARRRFAISLSPSNVMYSTQSCISLTVPEPTLPATYASQPSCSHRSRNSCVPKAFVSVTMPQCVLIIAGRLSRGPMPSIQWYSSAKQPPGQRSTGMSSFLRASTTSVRMPRTFGISESSPTQNPS